MRSKLFNNEGYIKVATKQGKKQKLKDVSEKNQQKNICLTCTRTECSGNCVHVRKKEKEGK